MLNLEYCWSLNMDMFHEWLESRIWSSNEMRQSFFLAAPSEQESWGQEDVQNSMQVKYEMIR